MPRGLMLNSKQTDKKTLTNVIKTVGEFTSIEFREKRKLLAPWLKEEMIALITSSRGIGKTWFAASLLDAVTKSQDFGPWKIENSVPCLYLEGEMAVQDVMERFNTLGNTDDRQSPLYIYSDAYANYKGHNRANLLNPEWRNEIKDELIERGVKLWVVDNLASLSPGIDENSKKDWDPINSWLLDLRFSGISTVMLHHANRMGEQRGTSAREDNIDMSLVLKHPPKYTPEDGANFIVHFNKHRIAQKDLDGIVDITFKLQDVNGKMQWKYGNAKKEMKKIVLKMFNEGLKARDISEILEVTKGRISQIKASLINDGCPHNRS
jgi:hypothetical protein